MQGLPTEYDLFPVAMDKTKLQQVSQGIQKKSVLNRTQQQYEPYMQNLEEDFHHNDMEKQHKPYHIPPVEDSVFSSIQTVQAVEQHCELQVHYQTTGDRLLHCSNKQAIKQPCQPNDTPMEECGSLQTIAHYSEPVTEQIEHHKSKYDVMHCEHCEPTTRLRIVEKRLHCSMNKQAVNEQYQLSSTSVMKQENYVMSIQSMKYHNQHDTTKQMEHSLLPSSIPVTKQQSEGYRLQTMEWPLDSIRNTSQQITPSVQEVDHSISYNEAIKRQFKDSGMQISEQKIDSREVKRQHEFGINQAPKQSGVQLTKHQISYTRTQGTEEQVQLQRRHPLIDNNCSTDMVTLTDTALEYKEDYHQGRKKYVDSQSLHRKLLQIETPTISHGKKLKLFQDESVLIYLALGICILLGLMVLISFTIYNGILLSALFINVLL